MLSSVLGSDRAIAVNIQIMRAFVRLRDLLSSNRELARRFQQLRKRGSIRSSPTTMTPSPPSSPPIRELMKSPPPKRRGIGFTAKLDEK